MLAESPAKTGRLLKFPVCRERFAVPLEHALGIVGIAEGVRWDSCQRWWRRS